MFINEDLAGEYFSIHQLRARNKNISIPDNPNDQALAILRVYNFQLTTPPTPPVGKKAVQDLPSLIDGVAVQQWKFEDETPDDKLSRRKARERREKREGVLINGVMCSATKDDALGLVSVEPWVLAGNDTDFEFQNGNKLTLTAANFAEFMAIWRPFRANFFND